MKRHCVTLTVTLLALFGGLAGQTAQAHNGRHMKLEARRDLQKRIIKHDKDVLRFFRNHPIRTLSRMHKLPIVMKRQHIIRYHYLQEKWTRRELAETIEAIRLKAARLKARRILEARRKQERILTSFMGNIDAWTCIHNGEGAWNSNTGNGYYGGLQMDVGFMTTYGSDMIAKYGGYANLWSPQDQIIVAQRAYNSGRGYHPWPHTAHACGLI